MALTNKLSAIGDAIRAKTGGTELLTLDQMPIEIASITTGGSGEGGNIHEWEDWKIGALYSTKEFYENDRVTLVVDHGLDGAPISHLSLPNATMINSYGLANNTSAAAIYIPKVTRLSTYALYNTGAAGVTVCDLSNIESIESKCFQTSGIVEVNLPKITALNDYYNIADNSDVVNWTLPEVLTAGTECGFDSADMNNMYAPKLHTIAGKFITNSTTLKALKLPALTGTLKVNAFNGCSALEAIDLGNIDNITFSSNYNSPFYNCSALNTIVLRNSSVVTLSKDAATQLFKNTKNFITEGSNGYIYVPTALVEEYKVATNWTSVATRFRAIEDYEDTLKQIGCLCDTSLKELSFTDNHWSEFNSEQKYTGLILPNVTTIAMKDNYNYGSTFSMPYCSYIELPKALNSGSYGANGYHNGCPKLATLKLPVCETIDPRAFAYMSNSELRTVILPKAKTVGEGCFYDSSVRIIIFGGETMVTRVNDCNPWADHQQTDTSYRPSIYVRAALVDQYKADPIFGECTICAIEDSGYRGVIE